MYKVAFGTPGGTRTPNLVLRTHSLYPLSYRGNLVIANYSYKNITNIILTNIALEFNLIIKMLSLTLGSVSIYSRIMIHKFLAYLLKHQIIFALFIIAFGWLVIQIRDIIVSVFVSYIIMSAFLPYTKMLRRIGLPKIIAVFIPYIVVIIAIFLIIVPLIPFSISQGQQFVDKFPLYLTETGKTFGVKINVEQVESFVNSQMNTLGRNAFEVTTTVFGGFFSVLTVFIISFYMLYYQGSFNKFVGGLFHPDDRPTVISTVDRINIKLGAWLRGQIVLSFTISVMSWIALTILNVPFALPLAVLAGLLEVVPTLGPIISAVPATIVAFTISPSLAISVIIAYVIIQLLENNILVPNIMRRAVGLNPVIVILGIVIGANLMGAAGALLAIPFISFIIVLFQSIEEKQ